MVDLHSLYLKPSLFCAPIVFPHFLTQCFVISFRMCQNQYGGWMRTQTQDGGGISKMCPNGKKKKKTQTQNIHNQKGKQQHTNGGNTYTQRDDYTAGDRWPTKHS